MSHSQHTASDSEPLPQNEPAALPPVPVSSEAEDGCLLVANAVYQVGDYLIGDAEDAKLGGHPDIRY